MRAHPEKFEGATEHRKCDTCLESRPHTFHINPPPAKPKNLIRIKEGRSGNANIYASHGYRVNTRPPKIDDFNNS